MMNEDVIDLYNRVEGRRESRRDVILARRHGRASPSRTPAARPTFRGQTSWPPPPSNDEPKSLSSEASW